MRLEVSDVVKAVSELVKKGYDREYRIKEGQLFDLALNSSLAQNDIHVDTALRLESGPDAGDASNIYAISDRKTQNKGLLIDAFDMFDEICSDGLSEQLTENRYAAAVDDDDVSSRYGLRKVYKDEFNGDPERYVLRIGYPDFQSVAEGAFVRLSGRYFIIAVSTDRSTCDGREVMGISTRAPIFEAIEGARAGETVEFNGKKLVIEEVA